ncbi:MAG: hypothetical protein HFJ26_08625 [Clostridia bacterium]|nr:hypothetical protein [Clostridia bacterium]
MIEDKIQEAIKPIISIYNQIELDIIERIAEHFKLNEEFINIDYWYLEKLKEMGVLNNQTMKLLEKYTGKTKQELLKAMQDIGIEAIPTEQINIAQNNGILFKPHMITIQNIIQHQYDYIEKTFLQLNKNIEEQVRKTYTDIVTQTYIKTTSGVYSYQEAILQSLDELGDKGISVLTYQDKNGLKKNYDVVGTVRRDLLVATRGLAGKVNEEVIKESGHHIIRVSHHFGARTGDGEENFTNHAWWQEKQFFCWNYDGKATEEEKKLPDFMEHCNYGHLQGIVGINCKHFFTIWYGPLKKDKLDFTYQENQEQYEKSQQQRYLENGVRKWKRKQVIANKAEDKEGYKKASAKTKEWQDRLNAFTTENDLKRDYTREHVKDYKTSKYSNNNSKLEYEDITNNILTKEDKKFEVKEQQYFIGEDGKQYNIDGKNVKIKANEKERQVAELLGKTYGGQVNLVPVVLNPQGIKTPDYILNGKKYDLKEIFGNSKNTIYNAITKKKGQSENFIFDISKTEMQQTEAIKQIQLIYKSKHKNWLNEIILIKNNEVIKIYQRQK